MPKDRNRASRDRTGDLLLAKREVLGSLPRFPTDRLQFDLQFSPTLLAAHSLIKTVNQGKDSSDVGASND